MGAGETASLVTQWQTVSLGNRHTSSFIQTEQVIFRNIYVYAYTCMHTKTIREQIGPEFAGTHGGEKAMRNVVIILFIVSKMKRKEENWQFLPAPHSVIPSSMWLVNHGLETCLSRDAHCFYVNSPACWNDPHHMTISYATLVWFSSLPTNNKRQNSVNS